MSAHYGAAVQVAKLAAIRGWRVRYDGSVKVSPQGDSATVLMEFPEWRDALEYFKTHPAPGAP